MISTFLVEIHIDDVFEVLPVVRVEFLSNETYMYVYKYKRRFTEKIMIIDLYMVEIFNFSTFGGKKRVIEVWATKHFLKDKITGRVSIYSGTFLR